MENQTTVFGGATQQAIPLDRTSRLPDDLIFKGMPPVNLMLTGGAVVVVGPGPVVVVTSSRPPPSEVLVRAIAASPSPAAPMAIWSAWVPRRNWRSS